MCSRRKISFLGVWVLLTITCIKAFPDGRQSRQDDDDDSTASTTNPINFGAQVAQIITGALTGNIDSIIKGSFGFIEDPNVNKLSHNTWETLKGNPTQTPPWATTTENTETKKPTQAAPAAPPPPPPPQPPKETEPVRVSSLSAPPLTPEVESAPSSGSSGFPGGLNGFNPGSSFYQTPAPTRNRQPTYTLAPLSVIEGTGQTETEAAETEEPSTTAGSDPDDEDGDEAEGRSGEVTEATSTKNPNSYSINRSTTDGVTTGQAETTTEDDDDDQPGLEEAFYSA